MKEVTVQELKELIDANAEFQLVDVREPFEAEQANINGELIPMGEVPQSIEKFSKDKKVIVHCRSGKRSATVIGLLESQHGFDNLYNLKGGIMEYAEKIDNTLSIS